jgi:hypothetical protein
MAAHRGGSKFPTDEHTTSTRRGTQEVTYLSSESDFANVLLEQIATHDGARTSIFLRDSESEMTDESISCRELAEVAQ